IRVFHVTGVQTCALPIFSNEFQDEVIISQIIQPGSKVKRNSKIALIVSNGPEIGTLRVPDLVGKTLDEARKIIIDAKLRLGKITYQASSDVTPGKVLDQYPKGEKSANETTVVDLFVSKKRAVELEEELPDLDVEEDSETNNGNKPEPQNPGDEEQKDQTPPKEKKNTKKDKKDTKVVPKPVEEDEIGRAHV